MMVGVKVEINDEMKAVAPVTGMDIMISGIHAGHRITKKPVEGEPRQFEDYLEVHVSGIGDEQHHWWVQMLPLEVGSEVRMTVVETETCDPPIESTPQKRPRPGRVFEARELRDYTDYVDAADLVEGRTYFTVHLLDNEGMVPEVRTLVFIGRDLEEGDQDLLYFQDAGSHREGVRYDDEASDARGEIHTVSAGTRFVMEFDEALNQLLDCSLRRG